MQHLETKHLLLRPLADVDIHLQMQYAHHGGPTPALQAADPDAESLHLRYRRTTPRTEDFCVILDRESETIVGFVQYERAIRISELYRKYRALKGVTLYIAMTSIPHREERMHELLVELLDWLILRRQAEFVHWYTVQKNCTTAQIMQALGFRFLRTSYFSTPRSPVLYDYFIHAAGYRPQGTIHYSTTFATSGMYAIAATMLTQLGHPTSDRDLALSIDLPYMIEKRDGMFYMGGDLCQNEWLNRALLPLGFRMVDEVLPREAVPDRLLQLPIAAVPLQVSKARAHYCVFTGKNMQRFLFTNLTIGLCAEKTELSLTRGAMRKMMPDTVTLKTLVPCKPQPLNTLPLLLRARTCLLEFITELNAAWKTRIDRPDQAAFSKRYLHTPLLAAIPMVQLTGDVFLYERFCKLRHWVMPYFAGRYLWLNLPYHIDTNILQECLGGLKELQNDRIFVLEEQQRERRKQQRLARKSQS